MPLLVSNTMVEQETEEAIELLKENVEELTTDESTELQKGVALTQAVHNAKSALELFEENH